MDQHVVVEVSTNGLSILGPFDTKADAENWIDSLVLTEDLVYIVRPLEPIIKGNDDTRTTERLPDQ